MLAIIDWFQWYQIAFSCWKWVPFEFLVHLKYVIYLAHAISLPDHANQKDSCWICLLIWIKQFANKHPIVEYVKNHKRGIFCGVLNVPTLTACTWFCCRFVFWSYFISNDCVARLLWTYNSQDVAFCCDLYMHIANVLYSTIWYDRYFDVA